MKTVILQPMLFPWVGYFEQIKQADIFVFYDDVQFSKGSFTNRVQVKTPDGFNWLTIPLKEIKLGKKINEYETNDKINWRQKHKEFLKQLYRKAPFFGDMYRIVDKVYNVESNKLVSILVEGIKEITLYLGLNDNTKFYLSSDLGISGSSSERVLSITKFFNTTIYITGHGAKNYLDHELFEMNNIKVYYMDYQKKTYPQLYGDFNPYVTILDLIANVGKDAIKYVTSDIIYWKNFLNP